MRRGGAGGLGVYGILIGPGFGGGGGVVTRYYSV